MLIQDRQQYISDHVTFKHVVAPNGQNVVYTEGVQKWLGFELVIQSEKEPTWSELTLSTILNKVDVTQSTIPGSYCKGILDKPFIIKCGNARSDLVKLTNNEHNCIYLVEV